MSYKMFLLTKEGKHFILSIRVNSENKEEKCVMEKKESFGRFIKEKRLAANPKITLREMSEKLGLNLTMLSDIENGRKKPFQPERIELFSQIMKLSGEEKEKMYDLAARDMDEVPADISEDLMYTEYGDCARKALRMTKEGKITEAEWKKFIREAERKNDRF